MEQCKWLARLYFILWIILINVQKTDTTCVLPPVLANSVWTYSQNVTTGQATFGKSTMAGLGVIARGNELKECHCISNTTDVYVFKSDSTYSDRGRNRWIYRCMKVTKVTENLVYLYFLSDLDSTVIPPSRIYSPLPDNVPNDDQSTCRFCNYTQPPKAEEYFLLKRENTDEKLTMTPNPCLPCEADCTKDHCDLNPCQNGGSCTSGLDGYTCKCTAGWMNKNCSVFTVSTTDRGKNQVNETKSDFSEREVIVYTAAVACVLVVMGLCYLVNKYRIMLHSKQLKIKEESLKNKTVKKKDEVLEMEDNDKDDDDDDSLYDVINESEIKDRVLPTNHAYLEITEGPIDSQIKNDDYLTPMSSLSRDMSSRNIQLYHYPQIHRLVSDGGSSSESVVRTDEYLNPYLPLRELYTSISHRYEIPRLYSSLKNFSELRGKYLNSTPQQDVNNTNPQALFEDKE